MYPVYKKEISSFFSSLTAYLVVGVFLTANGLFLWIFPGEYNLFSNGQAHLNGLFFLAPWLFLFLVPAVCMRMIAEEYRAGTMELLMSRPLTLFQVIFAKYLAALTLVILSLLPALVYYLSVYILGDPPGNIDSGGTAGSFLGLFFLASIYVAIGLFSSALTSNQIVSFLLAMVLSFIVFAGFDYLGTLSLPGSLDEFFVRLGIQEHYRSMSRGVIDSRDVVYFLCMNAFFLLLTRLSMQLRK